MQALHKTPWDGRINATTVMARPAYVPSTPPTPDYYSANTFRIENASEAFRWLSKLGSKNRAALTTLSLHVGAWYRHEQKAWRWLFLFLAKPANFPNLRRLEVSWEAEVTPDAAVSRRNWGETMAERIVLQGGGRDVVAVRALGRMQHLESLIIGGYFAVDWLQYLQDQGVKVQFDDWARNDRSEFQRQFPPLASPSAPCPEEVVVMDDFASVTR